MASARFSSDVLQMFYGPIPREENINLPEPLQPDFTALYDFFKITQNDFHEWLRVWRMDVSARNPNNKDLLMFARANKEKYTELIEQEIRKLGSVKVSFGLEVSFSMERNGETQHMKHYFHEKEPHVFNRNDGAKEIEKEFKGFIEEAKGEIENWSERGSGWEIESINIAHINVARYQPLRGGTYLPLPASLAKKKAVVNVKNTDNECLKWALRAALFPPEDGKNPQRPSKYSKEDGIDYTGIDFPTPLKHIDKLEDNNPKLAINVFGWENGCVTIHRLSKKEKKVERINLIVIESRETQHYCWVKRESALLFDQTKNRNRKYVCMMCLRAASPKYQLDLETAKTGFSSNSARMKPYGH